MQDNIRHLFPDASRPLADREMMLREVLSGRVRQWLSGGHFWLHELAEMRAIARDIQGLPPDKVRVPKDLEVLRNLAFASVSPANRKSALMAVVDYVGPGADLYGADAWRALQEQVALLCGEPLTDRAPTTSADEWVLDTICEQALRMFRQGMFDISVLKEAHEAMQELRRHSGLGQLDKVNSHPPRWAALQVLHCAQVNEMSAATKAGLVPAIMTVLGLDRADTVTLLGQARQEALVASLRSGCGVDGETRSPSCIAKDDSDGGTAAMSPPLPKVRRPAWWKAIFTRKDPTLST